MFLLLFLSGTKTAEKLKSVTGCLHIGLKAVPVPTIEQQYCRSDPICVRSVSSPKKLGCGRLGLRSTQRCKAIQKFCYLKFNAYELDQLFAVFQDALVDIKAPG